MAVKVDLTPSPHPLPSEFRIRNSEFGRGRGPGGRGEVESNIVEGVTEGKPRRKGRGPSDPYEPGKQGHKFHIEPFGTEVPENDSPVLEAFVAEMGVAV